MTSHEQKIIYAVRNDKHIGRGTCSTYDECYTDQELLYDLHDRFGGLPSVKQAVAYFRLLERKRQSHADDIRNA